MFRFDCTFSNFNCTKRVQLHTILRPGQDCQNEEADRSSAPPLRCPPLRCLSLPYPDDKVLYQGVRRDWLQATVKHNVV